MHDRPLFAEAPADVIAVFLLNRPTNVTVLVGWESAANAGHPRTGRNCQFSLPPSPPSVRRACCFLDQKRRSGPTIGTPSVISITAASVRPGRPSCRSKGERAKQRLYLASRVRFQNSGALLFPVRVRQFMHATAA